MPKRLKECPECGLTLLRLSAIVKPTGECGSCLARYRNNCNPMEGIDYVSQAWLQRPLTQRGDQQDGQAT